LASLTGDFAQSVKSATISTECAAGASKRNSTSFPRAAFDFPVFVFADEGFVWLSDGLEFEV
jgi:hypothetical protein